MYNIFKTNFTPTRTEGPKWSEPVLMDVEPESDAAVVLAQIYAQQHADAIGVPWSVSGDLQAPTGGTFVTSAGTHVFYTAKPATAFKG